jgi:hypothetical protein
MLSYVKFANIVDTASIVESILQSSIMKLSLLYTKWLAPPDVPAEYDLQQKHAIYTNQREGQFC